MESGFPESSIYRMLLGFRSRCTTCGKGGANIKKRDHWISLMLVHVWSVSLPLGSGGSQQSWRWCRAQHWPLSQKKTSAWGSYPTAPLLSLALSPDKHTCPHHTPDTHTPQHKDNPSVCWQTPQNLTVSESSHTNVTDVFQSDDVGMLSVSHQDFDLFRGVPLTFVYNLWHKEIQITVVNVKWYTVLIITQKSFCCAFLKI